MSDYRQAQPLATQFITDHLYLLELLQSQLTHNLPHDKELAHKIINVQIYSLRRMINQEGLRIIDVFNKLYPQ